MSHRRPGDGIRAIASRLFAQQTMERVIDPILADLQCEYDAARERGALWGARLSLARSYVAFGRALFWLGVRTAWHAGGPGSEAAPMYIVSGLAFAVVTIVLAAPPLVSWPGWRADPTFAALLFLTLVPQALPLSLPAGLCVAVLWAMRGKTVTWRRVATVLAIALACTTLVWIVLEWLMPQANQGFREMAAARISNGRVVTLEPGLNELGLSRLGQRRDPAAVRHYQVLWALCFASAPLSLLAFGLARHVRRAASAVVLAIALTNAYFAILWVCMFSTAGATTPASLPAWAPNVIFVLAGCALLVRGPRRYAQQ